MKIEVAMHQSTAWSWQTKKCRKGNHCRRTQGGNLIPGVLGNT